ncbi:class I SAM-dependent methyltransferase [Humidesulfovibrio idahonensis]
MFLTTRDAYDRWAPGYDGYDNPMVAAAARVVEELGRGLPAGAHVFEFGCGTGRNLAALGRLGAGRLAGCDLSTGMLAEAARCDPTLLLFQHDMTMPLPMQAGVFDCVLFCLTLEHLAEMAPPLCEARRILRPGGCVQVIEIHPLVSASGVAAHFRDQGGTVRMPVHAHTAADYETAFNAAGLRVAMRRDWLPRDFGDAATAKMRKRGEDFPLLVHYRAVAK